jgi:VanZ family protein
MRSENNSYFYGLTLTAMVTVVIAGLMLFPVTAAEIVGDHSDKLYHIIAFGALTFPSALLHLQLSRVVLIFAILFGALIEVIQPYVGRSGSWEDFLADVLGALLGWVFARVIRKQL